MIQRHLTVFYLLGRDGVSSNFTVRAPQCRSDDKHSKTSWDDLEASDTIVQISHV